MISQKKSSILIIDDDLSILRTLNRVLSKAGYVVETARTGNEASGKFVEKRFDVALIDIGLGEMEGTDLFPQMNKTAPNMLKIIFTGTPMNDEVLEKARSGADVFLLKPVKPEMLLEILEEKLGKKS